MTETTRRTNNYTSHTQMTETTKRTNNYTSHTPGMRLAVLKKI